MADETKAVDEFLGDLKNEGTVNPFDAPEEDLFNEKDSQTKDNVEEGATGKKEDKPLPFHKDPKIQRYIEKEISKRIPESQPVSYQPDPVHNDIDDVLTRIIGNDTNEKVSAISDFKRILLEREDRGAQKALQLLQSQYDSQLQMEKAAEDTLLSGFEAIEEENGIDITSSAPQARKLRGQLIDFIKQIAPKDEHGEIIEFPDIQESYKVFQSMKGQSNSNQRAKELASRSINRGSNSEASQPKENLSWHNWDRIKEKLIGQ